MADDNFIMQYVIEREEKKVLNRQPLLSIYYERGLFPPTHNSQGLFQNLQFGGCWK